MGTTGERAGYTGEVKVVAGATKGPEELLRELGYRLTPQRLMILAILESHEGNLSAEEICEEVRSHYPDMTASTNISTVYRTLELLKELGLVAEIDLGDGRVRYHWEERGRHHHLICERCKSITEVDDRSLETLREVLLKQHGFRATLADFAIFGLCAACQGQP